MRLFRRGGRVKFRRGLRGGRGSRSTKSASVNALFAIAGVLSISLPLSSCDSVPWGPSGAQATDEFMFHVLDPGHSELLGSDFAWAVKDSLNENMLWTAPPYFWADLEPVHNEFDWAELDGFVGRNRGLHHVMNLRPDFMPAGGGDFYVAGELPPWIDNSWSNPELKSQYGEMVEAVVERYRDDFDMWWIGLEVNLGGDGFGWEEWKDWFAWQVDLMRGVDPEARIAVSFGAWRDCAEPAPNAIGEVEGALELVSEGVDCDVMAIEYHYGTLQAGDCTDLEAALSELEAVGKDIFIWDVFYPAETDTLYQDCSALVNEPPGGYTEEWQADQWLETISMAYEDPQIIGINAFHFQAITYAMIDPADSEAGWRCHAGFVRADGTPRKAYRVVKAYWNSVLGG